MFTTVISLLIRLAILAVAIYLGVVLGGFFVVYILPIVIALVAIEILYKLITKRY